MFQIESVSREDGTRDWYVKHQNATGDTIEVKAPSGEVAIAYALLSIESLRRAKEHPVRLAPVKSGQSFPTLSFRRAKGLDTSTGPEKNSATPSVGGINRIGLRMPQAALGLPTTCGRRMAWRRLELKLTQAQVAARVTLEPKSGKNESQAADS